MAVVTEFVSRAVRAPQERPDQVCKYVQQTLTRTVEVAGRPGSSNAAKKKKHGGFLMKMTMKHMVALGVVSSTLSVLGVASAAEISAASNVVVQIDGVKLTSTDLEQKHA